MEPASPSASDGVSSDDSAAVQLAPGLASGRERYSTSGPLLLPTTSPAAATDAGADPRGVGRSDGGPEESLETGRSIYTPGVGLTSNAGFPQLSMARAVAGDGPDVRPRATAPTAAGTQHPAAALLADRSENVPPAPALPGPDSSGVSARDEALSPIAAAAAAVSLDPKSSEGRGALLFEAAKREADVTLGQLARRARVLAQDATVAAACERIAAIADEAASEPAPEFRRSCTQLVRILEAERRRCGPSDHTERSLLTQLLFVLSRCSRLASTHDRHRARAGGPAAAAERDTLAAPVVGPTPDSGSKFATWGGRPTLGSLRDPAGTSLLIGADLNLDLDDARRLSLPLLPGSWSLSPGLAALAAGVGEAPRSPSVLSPCHSLPARGSSPYVSPSGLCVADAAEALLLERIEEGRTPMHPSEDASGMGSGLTDFGLASGSSDAIQGANAGVLSADLPPGSSGPTSGPHQPSAAASGSGGAHSGAPSGVQSGVQSGRSHSSSSHHAASVSSVAYHLLSRSLNARAARLYETPSAAASDAGTSEDGYSDAEPAADPRLCASAGTSPSSEALRRWRAAAAARGSRGGAAAHLPLPGFDEAEEEHSLQSYLRELLRRPRAAASWRLRAPGEDPATVVQRAAMTTTAMAAAATGEEPGAWHRMVAEDSATAPAAVVAAGAPPRKAISMGPRLPSAANASCEPADDDGIAWSGSMVASPTSAARAGVFTPVHLGQLSVALGRHSVDGNTQPLPAEASPEDGRRSRSLDAPGKSSGLGTSDPAEAPGASGASLGGMGSGGYPLPGTRKSLSVAGSALLGLSSSAVEGARGGTGAGRSGGLESGEAGWVDVCSAVSHITGQLLQSQQTRSDAASLHASGSSTVSAHDRQMFEAAAGGTGAALPRDIGAASGGGFRTLSASRSPSLAVPSGRSSRAPSAGPLLMSADAALAATAAGAGAVAAILPAETAVTLGTPSPALAAATLGEAASACDNCVLDGGPREDCELCRLCEQRVPVSLLEAHMRECKAANADEPRSRQSIGIDDFELIKPISKGAFGKVFLARKRTTGDLFAIKVLSKQLLIRKNLVDHLWFERDIMSFSENPFVVRLLYSFTTETHVYLVMEYLPGGDLYSLLRAMGRLDESAARGYMAELVMALAYLHSLGVIHRDIKPDNFLIAADGHIKLADFGLSVAGLMQRTDGQLSSDATDSPHAGGASGAGGSGAGGSSGGAGGAGGPGLHSGPFEISTPRSIAALHGALPGSPWFQNPFRSGPSRGPSNLGPASLGFGPAESADDGAGTAGGRGSDERGEERVTANGRRIVSVSSDGNLRRRSIPEGIETAELLRAHPSVSEGALVDRIAAANVAAAALTAAAAAPAAAGGALLPLGGGIISLDLPLPPSLSRVAVRQPAPNASATHSPDGIPGSASGSVTGSPQHALPPSGSGPFTATARLLRRDYSLKKEQQKGARVMGTPDYLAPEVLLGVGHDAGVDWWALGVVLYELLVGVPPFAGKRKSEVFDNILNRKLEWPPAGQLSEEAKDLIDRLLQPDPALRLGHEAGAAELMTHPFFAGLDWEALAQLKDTSVVSFVPAPDNPEDTSYFTVRRSSSRNNSGSNVELASSAVGTGTDTSGGAGASAAAGSGACAGAGGVAPLLAPLPESPQAAAITSGTASGGHESGGTWLAMRLSDVDALHERQRGDGGGLSSSDDAMASGSLPMGEVPGVSSRGSLDSRGDPLASSLGRPRRSSLQHASSTSLGSGGQADGLGGSDRHIRRSTSGDQLAPAAVDVSFAEFEMRSVAQLENYTLEMVRRRASFSQLSSEGTPRHSDGARPPPVFQQQPPQPPPGA